MNTQAKFDFPKVPAGKPFSVRLMLSIEGQEQPGKKRSPLNLSLVLDRSGSMQGEKLANVKEATRLLVNQLAKDDIFSLVIFDDKVKKLIAPVKIGDAHELESVISGIRAGGSTFLSGGYEAGCALAGENTGEGYVSRVMLLTDGLANVGLQDPERLAAYAGTMQKEGITTTTIGVGDDYAESLLGGIAEYGGGGSYFIETPDDAPRVFVEELGCLMALSATDCEVRFVSETEGVRFGQLNSYKVGEGGAFLLGDVYGGQKKKLMLELELPGLVTEEEVRIGRFELSYRDTMMGQAETKSVSLPVTLSVIPADKFVGIDPDLEVTLEASFLVVARAKAESLALADKGQYSKAADLLDKYVSDLKRLDLADAALLEELYLLESRARELRERGKDFFTANERKRMFHEADMMSKSRLANYQAMMSRRVGTDDETEERAQRFPCYRHNGHILAEIGADRCLIDTGALKSFGDGGQLALGGKTYRLQKEYFGHDVEEICRIIGTRISALLGADILKTFDTVIDLAAGEVIFSTKPLTFPGTRIPARYFQGIPVVSCEVGNREAALFLDSGAKLSFLDETIAARYPRLGEDTDFFPGFGEFKTDVYRVPVKTGNEHFELSVGVLPTTLQMALSLASAVGVIGSALFDEYAVCLSAGAGGVTLRKHSRRP
ncbi:MAG TPA: VWA domain-containing protein [Geobacteraceae bacterium]|nr:VWA domain-containing protein [Geobacteraceae bacterium]